jgi:hypothetical protein
MEQDPLILVGGVPADLLAQPAQGYVDCHRQMPFSKLGLAANINDHRALPQTGARLIRPQQGKPPPEEERHDPSADNEPASPIHNASLWPSIPGPFSDNRSALRRRVTFKSMGLTFIAVIEPRESA